MRIRFQADADLNQAIVAAVLRRLPEADFRTATDARLAGLHDLEVLAIAARDGRLLVTSDRQTMPGFFGEFITKTESPGVIVARQRLAVGEVLEDLALIWTASRRRSGRTASSTCPSERGHRSRGSRAGHLVAGMTPHSIGAKGAEVERVAGRLAFQYDREADILHIRSRPPYAEQESEDLGDDVIARLNPKTGDVESLEVLFFSTRLFRRDLFELPVTADFHRAG